MVAVAPCDRVRSAAGPWGSLGQAPRLGLNLADRPLQHNDAPETTELWWREPKNGRWPGSGLAWDGSGLYIAGA
jgi:hypothetical protein